MDLHFFTKSDWLHIYEKERRERYYLFFLQNRFGMFLQSSKSCDLCCFCNYSLQTVATHIDSSAYIVDGDNSCRYCRNVVSPLCIHCISSLAKIIRLKGRYYAINVDTHSRWRQNKPSKLKQVVAK